MYSFLQHLSDFIILYASLLCQELYISNLWEKILAINFPITGSSFKFDSLYKMIRPILSFKEIIGTKTKLPSSVYSPTLNEIVFFYFYFSFFYHF